MTILKKTDLKILTYTGSKIRELDKIEENIKNHINSNSLFVDVFGGSGVVGLYFMNKYNIPVIFNDVDKKLCDFLEVIKNKDDYTIFLERYKIEYDKYQNFTYDEKFNYFCEIVKGRPYEDKIKKVLFYFMINKLCFRGIMNMKDLKPNMKKVNGMNIMEDRLITINKIDTFHNLICNELFDISNNDFKNVMDKYKHDENTILYLDPPYIRNRTCSEVYDNCINMDCIYWMVDFMKNSKCKVLLHIDYNPILRDFLLKDMLKDVYIFNYNVNKKELLKKFYQKAHCIYMNT